MNVRYGVTRDDQFHVCVIKLCVRVYFVSLTPFQLCIAASSEFYFIIAESVSDIQNDCHFKKLRFHVKAYNIMILWNPGF
jgi:hypothetical protein